MVRQSQARPSRGRASRARQPQREALRKEPVPDVFQEMLEEAEARDPEQFHSDRPIKRRRVGDSRAIAVHSPAPAQADTVTNVGKDEEEQAQNVQTVYDLSETEESDIEWEDVEIQHQQQVPEASSAAAISQERNETLQITLEQEPEKPKKAVQRRKPVTAAEKKIRMDIHKVHLLCLLAHVNLRNRWCNDGSLQSYLKRMLPKRVIALLNPDEDKPQYLRSTTFIDGLNEAGEIFTRRFRVNKLGLRRPHWAEDQNKLKQRLEALMLNVEVFLSKEDFRSQAKTMQGSRDFGAQLFCALLRSVAVEARLVCSLQPLPFSGTVKDMTPSKKGPQYIVVSSDDHETSTDERQKSGGESPTASRARRLGRPEFTSRPGQASARLGSIPNPRESSYPVFWVEAFNEAVQRWFPIDPMVTKSLAKPSKFEPPASDPYNSMSYVVAFEDDASARDVTRRYAKAFNAKTRKLRIESTRNGEKWWDAALEAYEKPFLEDRDELEISELTSKSAAEPMPRNIQDFKDHPIYALEKHLHRNEVIFPKRVIGHVGLSKTTSKSDNLDPVYRRSDVHVVRSADKWYRLGRDVKVGEHPLKHVRATRPKSGFDSDEEDNEPEQTALYAEYQTEIYQPPPVVQGRIPKNSYGNLDIYVPSMVPPGGIHVRRPEAARAARILGIDYADAVTGFDFKGRRGTAVIEGIVVACEYSEALEEVTRGMADERHRAALEARSAEALRFWRLFLVKLRIAERVKEYAGSDEENDDAAASDISVKNLEESGGGFFPEPDQSTDSASKEPDTEDYYLGGGFIPDDPVLDRADAVDAGNEDGTVGGGFLPDKFVDGGPAVNPSTANGGQEDGLSGGGFMLDGSADAEPVPKPQAALQPVIPPRFKKGRASNIPRYELIVVPKNSATDSGQQSTKCATSKGLEGSSEQAPITVDSSTNGGSKSTSVVESISRPLSPQEELRQSQLLHDSDSEIEKGSLLSEDPDDEDAVPDWLI
ncbi:hypothetical protein N7448_005071 [Penicillium atrosanguineum]|uniref:uncharacterized protein n=1 Tax=Penicillium atrosanguineum TaxID=1132637 RepID=UPI0023885DF3|nr:uncharacterized protein N7443_008801 [Penicillium atrosanguineum]KAJ5136517.1 hypothetical protein N7448_005071 [Penicillium atrosanguineum]KAJ5292848.1 hypothetical protein N7443_008801 [Penicillium atrosanguineum]